MEFSVYFETLGCSKNQVDTEHMLGIMTKNAYRATTEPTEADVIVVNTCGFIEAAKQESVETILELLQLKEEGQCKVLVVTGCLSERYADQLKQELPEVDALIGTTKFDEILTVVEELLDGGQAIMKTGDIDRDLPESMPRALSTPDHYAFLKIAEGCDNLCTYCIIPKLRGKFRSRKMEDILDEAKRLADQGIKELILIAQDTTRYGIDLYGELKLAELLRKLNQVEGLRWIRVQYLYPDVIDDDLLDAVAQSDKVVKYFDMPIQHASNTVLKRMNRRTTGEHIQSVIDRIRVRMPDATLRTTLIVGFPGETEEEFAALEQFVKRAEFDRLGVFPYSQEEDTPAALLPDQVGEDIKLERRDRIMAIQMSISEKKMYQWVGREMEVLVEEVAEPGAIYIGRSRYDAPEVDGVVYVHTDQELKIGSFVTVKITDAMEYDRIGEM